MENTLAGTNRAKTRNQERQDALRDEWELEGYILRMEVEMLPDRKLSPYTWTYL